MNPITWSGPAFLFFYLVFGIAVLCFLYRFLMRKTSNLIVSASELAKDPYKIAYLSGGKSNALGVATVSLHDRGLLILDNENLHTVRQESIQSAQRHLEKAVLRYYLVPATPSIRPNYSPINAACDSYKQELQAQGLITNSIGLVQRILPCVIAAGLLAGISAAKINYAHAHGHYNTTFLFILTCIFMLVVVAFFFQAFNSRRCEALIRFAITFYIIKKSCEQFRSGWCNQ